MRPVLQMIPVLALVLGPVLEAQEPAPVRRSTDNPTGIQVGTANPNAGTLPPGSEELARVGAMASAEGNWAAAKAAYEEMLALAPVNPLVLSNLGAVEFRLGNLDRAEELLRRATNIAPEIGQNWVTLGLIYHRQERHYLALSALSRALNEDPNDPRAHNYMGVVVRELGWKDAAEMQLQRAVVLDPKYADAHYNLAVMYLEASPPLMELARRHYYTAVDYGAKPDERIERLIPPAEGGKK